MFKKFTKEVDVHGQTQMKTSVSRSVRQKILNQYPAMEEALNELIPKKTPVIQARCTNHVTLVICGGKILFFNLQRNGAYFPSLQLLHQYPNMLPHVQVDKGAIRHVLRGADIMCPGLTSPGGRMDVELEEDAIVAVMAEGKQHALGVGVLMMSTAQVREVNADVGITNVHYLGDGVYKLYEELK